MKDNKKNRYTSLLWVLLGAVLTVCAFAGVLDSYWYSFGVSLLVVGSLQLLRQRRYRKNEAYREQVDTETQDERNRFLGGIERGAMPPLHHLGAPALSLLARLRYKVPVRDFHCGLRAVSKDVALSLPLGCPGMEFATEMIAAFARSGAAMRELPTVLRRDRRGRRSHIRTFRDGWRHLKFILTN